MPAKIHTGCCGWSYLNEQEFADKLGGEYSSKLQAYAALFEAVEINSTFYRLPRPATAEKWRKEVDAIRPDFEFTVKAFKGITHLHRFQKKESLDAFGVIGDICSALNARYVLFQSPASFKPTPANIENMRWFFSGIDISGLTAVWEPRGTWYDDQRLIQSVCTDNKLVHCVDLFRNEPLMSNKIGAAYFRLHGFGQPTMYRYNFSNQELRQLCDEIVSLPPIVKDIYVFFNNEACYRNGLTFQRMIG